MSRNGSGTYSLPINSWNPAVNGASATTTDWQALIDDVASAMTQSVSKDGQTTLTGSIPAGGFKLTGLGAGSAAGESLRYEQLFSQGTITNIASAATTDIGAQLTALLNVTGTTTITSFGTNYNGPRLMVFAGILTLTHSATLVLPGAVNMTTAASDAIIAIPISGGWQVVATSVVADGSVTTAKLASNAVTTAKITDANVTPGKLAGGTMPAATGYSATDYSAGTKSSGTYTPDPANGNFQYATNGGAHTLAPPATSCTMIIQYTNNGSAGAITTSGFTKVSGAFTTTNGDDFMCYITRLNAFSFLNIQALQ